MARTKSVRAPLSDILDEGRAVVTIAEEQGISVRLTGGVAVALTCPSARRFPLSRNYGDLDLVGYARQSGPISDLLLSLGYVADENFNAMQGARRLLFWDPNNGRQLDVFLDKVEMCHVLDFRNRLHKAKLTLAAADLLLMKLQIVEANEKDLKDMLGLLVDHDYAGVDDNGIDLQYIAGLAAQSWGLWRTLNLSMSRVQARASSLEGFQEQVRVERQAQLFVRELDAKPKTRIWRLRARIGDRIRWYELPEDPR